MLFWFRRSGAYVVNDTHSVFRTLQGVLGAFCLGERRERGKIESSTAKIHRTEWKQIDYSLVESEHCHGDGTTAEDG